MLINLIYGCCVMVLCLLIQAALLVQVINFYKRNIANRIPGTFYTMRVVIYVMLALVLGNFFQIVVWGGLFLVLGEFSDFQTAVYHSAVNFATLGYGDIVMSEEHRLLGPLESINGVLMIGVSTAVLMGIIQDSFKREQGDS